MREISLTKGYVTLVDDEDYERLSRFRWQARKTAHNVYAYRTGKLRPGKWCYIALHRVIMEAPAGFHVDHRDCDGLNNQRSNLRICSYGQNMMNQRKTSKPKTSRFKGVTWDREKERWRAQIYSRKVNYKLGRFDDEEKAARAYDQAARELFGEFARLNFPDHGEPGTS